MLQERVVCFEVVYASTVDNYLDPYIDIDTILEDNTEECVIF